MNISLKESIFIKSCKRFAKNKLALVAAILLFAIIIFSLFGEFLRPFSFDHVFWNAILAPPSTQHWFGTDVNGRDLFLRIINAIRVSLLVGLVGTLVSICIGVVYGAVAGYVGGKTDAVMMRIVDIIYSLPFMFFVIVMMVFFGRNFILMFVGIGLVVWLNMARIIRGQTMSIKQKPFILAAKSYGASSFYIIIRHIIPNVLGIIAIYATLTIPGVVLIESFLSFLGLGVQEPQSSLGTLIKEGTSNMPFALWMLIFPASFLAVILACFNFIGDGLRDAFDPKEY